MRWLASAFRDMQGVTVYGPRGNDERVATLSISVNGIPADQADAMLDADRHVCIRTGLHCAPGAHRTIGTFPTGTVRFGFSYANTLAEVGASLEALAEIAEWARNREVIDE